MLYIGAKDFEKVVDFNRMMDCIERAYSLYEQGSFHMPDRMHVDRPEGTILYMPCFSGNISGTKIVSTFPGNKDYNVPTIQGTMILNSSKTGVPLALIDGAMLTAYRTGAVGGVGVRYTTRKDCDSLGLIGTGVQGQFQVLYACHARPIKRVTVYNRSLDKAESFKLELESKISNIEVLIAKDSREVVANSEIVITATPATSPVLPEDSSLLRGKHYIAIGSYKYEMRELPKSLYGVLDNLYLDTELAAKESGDLIVPVEEGWFARDKMEAFGKVYSSLKANPITDSKTTLYKSVGMALFDLIVAEEIYNSALQKGLGTKLGDYDE